MTLAPTYSLKEIVQYAISVTKINLPDSQRKGVKMVQDVEKLLVMLNKLGTVNGRTRFQKIVFLLKEKEGLELGYTFIPYHYGPYAHDLQLEMDLLEAAGFIRVEHQEDNLYVHSLTEQGVKVAERIAHQIDFTEFKKLSKLLEKYNVRSTKSLTTESKKLVGMSG